MLGMTIPCFEIHNLPFLKAVAAIHARTIKKHTLITYSCSRNDGLDTTEMYKFSLVPIIMIIVPIVVAIIIILFCLFKKKKS